MSRSDQYIGLNDWATEMLASCQAQATPYDKIEGAWNDDVASLHEYTLPDGHVYREYVQTSPWSSGPMYFIALKDMQYDEPVARSLWSDHDIDQEMGFSGEWSSELARQRAFVQLGYAMSYMQQAMADQDPIAITCGARRISDAAAACRCELDAAAQYADR